MRTAITVAVLLAVTGPVRADEPSERIKALRDRVTKLMMASDHFAARAACEELVKLTARVRGDRHRDTRRARKTLGTLLASTGDYAGATALAERRLREARAEHGPRSKELADATSALAMIYFDRLLFEKADETYAKAAEIYKRLWGAKSSRYANVLRRRALILTGRHLYRDAAAVYGQVLAIRRNHFGDNDRRTLAARRFLANTYARGGERRRAIRAGVALATKLRAVYKNKLRDLGRELRSLADLHERVGDLRARDALLREAAAVYRRLIRGRELDRFFATRNLARVASRLGDFDEAARLRRELLRRAEAKHGVDSIRIADEILGLGEVLEKQKKYDDAVALLLRAKKLYRKTYGGAVARIPERRLARIYQRRGDHAAAVKLGRALLAVDRTAYGDRHPMTAASRERLALALLAAGNSGAALRELELAYRASRRHIDLALASGAEQDNRAFLAKLDHQPSTAIALLAARPRDPRAARLALTTLLAHKGRLLDGAAARIEQLRERLSPADVRLLDELASVRAQLSKLVLSKPTDKTSNNQRGLIRDLETRERALERKVRASARLRAEARPIDLRAIQRALPRDAALVEITGYRRDDKPRYGAFVLGRRGPPAFVDLGAKRSIDRRVEMVRIELSSVDGDAKAGAKLYSDAFAPAVKAIGRARHVLLAPDGDLNLVPFAALVDSRGQYLVRRYRFSYLSSGRDLTRPGARAGAGGKTVIVANPTYGATAKTGRKRGHGRRSRDFKTTKWSQLPGTAAEAAAIARTLEAATVLDKSAATETAVKKLRAPKILHLATHGYFLPDQSDGGIGTGAENPMLRAGLVLAGANQLRSGDQDGVLTALEAASLDLFGTELVVLSACETAVGKVASGDGVHGLRRALVLAGSRSQLMTLWQVDDAATKDLMIAFYRRLLAGKPRAEALRLVQLKLLGSTDHQHPFYWAAFIGSGDWGPVALKRPSRP